MENLFIDKKRILSNSWNVGHGNKISHLLFVINLAEKLGVKPVIPSSSSLDDIFDLDNLKAEVEDMEIGECLFKENSAFLNLSLLEKLFVKISMSSLTRDNLNKSIKRSRIQAMEELAFLNADLSETKNGFVRGHFWHYNLMPSKEVFNKFISVRSDLLKECKEKYPDLESENTVMVHLRDTDFNNHLSHIFRKSIALPEDYFYKAIEKTEAMLGKDIKYHLFSDNHEKISRIFQDKDFVLHSDSAAMDWVCLFLGKNIIQSNSSFCWTASLYKQFSIQPKGGYNWAHAEKGDIPHGFKMPFSNSINPLAKNS